MGHVSANIELSNPKKPNLVPIKVKVFADTGALILCYPSIRLYSSNSNRKA